MNFGAARRGKGIAATTQKPAASSERRRGVLAARSQSGSASPPRRARSRSRRKQAEEKKEAKKDEAEEEEEKGKSKKDKEFAWMESGDEAEGSDKEGSEASSPSRAIKVPPPKSAEEVETLSQMMSLIENFERGKLLRMPMADIAELCKAAARVRYYDQATFGDVTSAMRVHFRGRGNLNADHIATIVGCLADVNAYDRDLFEAAAKAIGNKCSGNLDPGLRRVLLNAFKKYNHKSEEAIIPFLLQQEKTARYSAACEEVAACWQKPGPGVVVIGP